MHLSCSSGNDNKKRRLTNAKARPVQNVTPAAVLVEGLADHFLYEKLDEGINWKVKRILSRNLQTAKRCGGEEWSIEESISSTSSNLSWRGNPTEITP
jgi:hypothetical protein